MSAFRFRSALGLLVGTLALLISAGGCDTTAVPPPGPTTEPMPDPAPEPEPSAVLYSAPPHQLPDVLERDPASGELRQVVASVLQFEDGRYVWQLALVDPSGAARDTLTLEGPARLEGPILVLGDGDPIFGLVSENAVRLYARSDGEVGEFATDRDWVFLTPGTSTPAEPSFDGARTPPALDGAELRAVDGEPLPIAFRGIGRGNPNGGREVVLDSLRRATLTISGDRFETDVTYTQHSDSGLGDGTYTGSGSGAAYGAGDVVVLIGSGQAEPCRDRRPVFGVVRDGALTLRRPCLGVAYPSSRLVTFEFAE